MERNCDNCKYRDVYYKAPPCDECNFEYQRQPQKGFQNWEPDAMTNADRIRTMTDEELTELLYAWHLSTFCKKKEWIHNWLKKDSSGYAYARLKGEADEGN